MTFRRQKTSQGYGKEFGTPKFIPNFGECFPHFFRVFTQWKPIAFTGHIQERSVRVAVEFLEAAPSSTWKGNVRSMYISTVSRPTNTN